jgi:hypothetical protein
VQVRQKSLHAQPKLAAKSRIRSLLTAILFRRHDGSTTSQWEKWQPKFFPGEAFNDLCARASCINVLRIDVPYQYRTNNDGPESRFPCVGEVTERRGTYASAPDGRESGARLAQLIGT